MKPSTKRRLRGACAVLAAAAIVSAMVPTAAVAATAPTRPAVTITGKTATYDGEAHGATVSTTKDGYTVFYSKKKLTASNASTRGTTSPVTRTNAGTTYVYYACVPSSGKATAYNSKTGCYKQTIKKRSLHTVDFAAIPAQAYTGSAVKPALDITYNGSALVAGTDYKATYYSNKKVGTAKVIVYGRGNFTDTKTLRFKISKDIQPADTRIAFAVYSADDNSLNFYKRAAVPTAGEQFDGKAATAVYTGIEENEYKVAGDVPWGGVAGSITSVNFVDSGIKPVSTAYWFYGCAALTEIPGMDNLVIADCTDMYSMFEGCTNLASLDISGWDTSKVKWMSKLFSNCTSLTSLDISGWDTSSMFYTSWMFNGCSNLSTIFAGDGWKVSGVTASIEMFTGCTSLVGDGASYSSSKTDVSMANWETGYLTYKAAA